MTYHKLMNIKPFIFLSLVLLSLTSFGGANGTGRGGGDPIVEFQLIGKEIYESIKDIPLYRDHFQIPMDEFLQKVEKASVRKTLDPIIIEGEYKTASNNYSDDILVYVDGWNSIKNPILKKRLVFHEYLSLLKREWNNFYFISNTLYNDQFIAPLLVDLGILTPLNRYNKNLVRYLHPSHQGSFDNKQKILSIIYQNSVEELLKLYNRILQHPSTLKNDSLFYKDELSRQIKELKPYLVMFRNFHDKESSDVNVEIKRSQVFLLHIQAYFLIHEVNQFISSTTFYDQYIKDLKQYSSHFAKQAIDEIKLQVTTNIQVTRINIELELYKLEELLNSNKLTRTQKNQIKTLEKNLNFIYYSL